MAGVPDRGNGAPADEADDEGLREPLLALGWLTVLVVLVAWMVFSKPERHIDIRTYEEGGKQATEQVDTGQPAEPLREAPQPAAETQGAAKPQDAKAAAEAAAKAAAKAEASAEEAKLPAPPVAVPEGVGFGPGLGSRATPEAEPQPGARR